MKGRKKESWFELIMRQTDIEIFIREVDNLSCLKCFKVEPTMIMVGSALCFCNSCAKAEFGNTEKIDSSSAMKKKYLHWIEIYKKRG